MLKIKKHFWDIVFVLALVALVYKQLPILINSYKQEGQILRQSLTVDLNNKSVPIPLKNKRVVYLFWATWCSPCHSEMDKFKKAVKSGEIKKDQIIAVNLGEDLQIVNNFQAKKQHPFDILISSSSRPWQDLNIEVTPSLAFVNEDQVIEKFSAGFSFFSISKSKRFLNTGKSTD